MNCQHQKKMTSLIINPDENGPMWVHYNYYARSYNNQMLIKTFACSVCVCVCTKEILEQKKEKPS